MAWGGGSQLGFLSPGTCVWPLLHLDRFWGTDSRVLLWVLPPTSLPVDLRDPVVILVTRTLHLTRKVRGSLLHFLPRSFCCCYSFLLFLRTLHILIQDTGIRVSRHTGACTRFYTNTHSQVHTHARICQTVDPMKRKSMSPLLTLI